MQWFTGEVFGHITDRENVKVRVTGNTAGRDLAPLQEACPQVEFTGFVDDIRPYFAESGICIVPILSVDPRGLRSLRPWRGDASCQYPHRR